MKLRVIRYFIFGLFLLGSSSTLWAIKIEEAQRAVQERYQKALGTTVGWPAKINGTPAPAFPQDGFYGDDLLDGTKAAALVADLAGKLSSNPFLNQFVARDDGNVDGLSLSSIPVYSATNGMPPVTDIISSNYAERFSILTGYICKLKHIKKEATRVTVVVLDSGEDIYNDTCETAKAEAISQFGQYPYYPQSASTISFASGYVVYPPQGPGFCDVWLVTAVGYIQADLSSFPAGSRAAVYLGTGMHAMGLVGTPPTTADGKLHLYQTASCGGVYRSNDLATGTPEFGVSLETDGEFTSTEPFTWSGWYIDEQVAIVSPDFQNNIQNCGATEACTACTNCELGSGSLAAGSAKASFSLGHSEDGESAGNLFFDIEQPSASNATPAGLGTTGTGGKSQILQSSSGILRQVLAPETLADVVVVNDFKYNIDFYHRDQVSSTTNAAGVYTASGSPFTTWTIENPNVSTNNINTLRVTETIGSGSTVNEFVWSGADAGTVELSTGNGLRKESRGSIFDTNTEVRIETFIVKNSDDSMAYKEENVFHVFPWGEEQIQKVVDPDGAALTTIWSFYDNQATDGSNYKHLKEVVQPTGYWERYQYDGFGREIQRVTQYLDAPVGSAESAVE